MLVCLERAGGGGWGVSCLFVRKIELALLFYYDEAHPHHRRWIEMIAFSAAGESHLSPNLPQYQSPRTKSLSRSTMKDLKNRVVSLSSPGGRYIGRFAYRHNDIS